MAAISEKIFELLEEKKMSQRELALLTGIKESTISDWKNKGVNPSADKILSICKALEASPYDLLVEDGTPAAAYKKVKQKTKEYELIEVYRNMNSKQKKNLFAYIEGLNK